MCIFFNFVPAQTSCQKSHQVTRSPKSLKDVPPSSSWSTLLSALRYSKSSLLPSVRSVCQSATAKQLKIVTLSRCFLHSLTKRMVIISLRLLPLRKKRPFSHCRQEKDCFRVGLRGRYCLKQVFKCCCQT